MAQPLNAPPGKHRRLSGTGKSGMSSSSGTTSIRARSEWALSLFAWPELQWYASLPSETPSTVFPVTATGGEVLSSGYCWRQIMGERERERKVLKKMIVSLSGLCVEICGLNHIIIRKWRGAGPLFLFFFNKTWQGGHVWSPGQICCHCWIKQAIVEEQRGHLKEGRRERNVTNT